jgi:hypothetical protein
MSLATPRHRLVAVLTALVALLASALVFVTPASAAAGDFTITGVSQNEGSGGGKTTYSFTVTVQGPYVGQVAYTTDDGSAHAGDDYTDNDGNLFFGPGDTSKTIDVLVAADTHPEPNETFTVTIRPTPGACATCTATGTIINDDGAAPVATISSPTVTEGTSGSPTTATATITLDKASTQTVTVAYATSDDTAKAAGPDYLATSGTATFAPSETSKPITVPVVADGYDEPDEAF